MSHSCPQCGQKAKKKIDDVMVCGICGHEYVQPHPGIWDWKTKGAVLLMLVVIVVSLVNKFLPELQKVTQISFAMETEVVDMNSVFIIARLGVHSESESWWDEEDLRVVGEAAARNIMSQCAKSISIRDNAFSDTLRECVNNTAASAVQEVTVTIQVHEYLFNPESNLLTREELLMRDLAHQEEDLTWTYLMNDKGNVAWSCRSIGWPVPSLTPRDMVVMPINYADGIVETSQGYNIVCLNDDGTINDVYFEGIYVTSEIPLS